jgi:non-ribosomal peptide synthetase component E (peptide arylation enzyme)
MDATTHRAVAPPPSRFNFAQHLLELNAAHPDKPAFIDDRGALSYGELALRVRRLAAGLRALGLKREERVLLLATWVAASIELGVHRADPLVSLLHHGKDETKATRKAGAGAGPGPLL